MSLLDTGVKFARTPPNYVIGNGSLKYLKPIVIKNNLSNVVIFLDHFFALSEIEKLLSELGKVLIIDSTDEPTVENVDKIAEKLRIWNLENKIDAIIGVGGGTTLDTAKAISNLLTNPGSAAKYQGWDLVLNPAIFKIAVPTISGTGAEATRTCVMTNKLSGLKLGMNSDYSVFDYLILDPELTKSVPLDQYFYTAMDAYIHCVESLGGRYRNPIGDTYSETVISICEEVFNSKDIKSPKNRELLMVASYMGGLAIATSYVGLIHPFSAALSVVFGTHHCVGNCMALRGLRNYYPEASANLDKWIFRHGIELPVVDKVDDDEIFAKLSNATLIHERPLFNALGEHFRDKLNFETIKKCFREMM